MADDNSEEITSVPLEDESDVDLRFSKIISDSTCTDISHALQIPDQDDQLEDTPTAVKRESAHNPDSTEDLSSVNTEASSVVMSDVSYALRMPLDQNSSSGTLDPLQGDCGLDLPLPQQCVDDPDEPVTSPPRPPLPQPQPTVKDVPDKIVSQKTVDDPPMIPSKKPFNPSRDQDVSYV